MNVYEYMNVAGPIIYDLVLLAAFTTRMQLKAEGEVCFFIVLMGPDPRSSWFLDLSVKLYDNDDAKGVNFFAAEVPFLPSGCHHCQLPHQGSYWSALPQKVCFGFLVLFF